MAAPRVSFGEKDMENGGGDGAADRSRKWSQAPGNIEDLGMLRLSIRPSFATRLTPRQTSTLLCRSTSLPTEIPRPTTPTLRLSRRMLSSLGTSSVPRRRLLVPTLVPSPRRCSRPTSSRVSLLLRSSSAASATAGTKSPPRRRTCSSSSSVSSLVLSSMVSSSHSYPALDKPAARKRCQWLRGDVCYCFCKL
jgi:hypothetical protein